jgi:GDP-4-dehydro-6-deoxy-D-mannose reductase
VDDVVRAYRLLALQGKPGETYNVSSGEGRTVRSLLDELLEIAGVDAAVEVDRLRLRPAEIASLVGDSAKLRKLGWQPSRIVRDALRDVLQEARAAAGTGG